jgi:predicted CXXCH cytochrome family protein
VHCKVRYLTRKQRGGTAVREQTSEGTTFLVGRGNDCAVHLPDPRVLLHHAELSFRGGDIYIGPAIGADLRINGVLSQMSKLAVGDVVKIGPYDLILEENVGTGPFTISVELVQPLGDDLQRLTAQAKVGATRVTARSLSWALALVMAVAFFAAPWVASLFHEAPPALLILNSQQIEIPTAPTTVWTSGQISSAHKFFGDSCETCHVTPFAMVKDETCLTCHENVEHHADPTRFQFAAFKDKSCQSCHKEHMGHRSIVLSDEKFCANCHADMEREHGEIGLKNAADFSTRHSELRPTLVIDAALHVVDRSRGMSDTPPPVEDSALDFPHDRHLRGTGVRDPVRGMVNLDCGDCHRVDAGGAYMLPISYEKDCRGCHALKFDTFIPDRELVHGKPEEMFKQVRDVYDAVAMRGGYEEPAAPEIIRRRPGTPLTPEQKKQAVDWAVAKADAIMNGRFGRGLCDSCHQLFETQASPGPTNAGWGVEPVSASNVWFPKSKFSHASHRDVLCANCHAARTSTSSADVNMPDLATCQNCHGGESAADKVPSTCIMCHAFHRQDLGAMKDVIKATLETPPGAAVSSAVRP